VKFFRADLHPRTPSYHCRFFSFLAGLNGTVLWVNTGCLKGWKRGLLTCSLVVGNTRLQKYVFRADFSIKTVLFYCLCLI
jgi:hypothetical protein